MNKEYHFLNDGFVRQSFLYSFRFLLTHPVCAKRFWPGTGSNLFNRITTKPPTPNAQLCLRLPHHHARVGPVCVHDHPVHLLDVQPPHHGRVLAAVAACSAAAATVASHTSAQTGGTLVHPLTRLLGDIFPN